MSYRRRDAGTRLQRTLPTRRSRTLKLADGGGDLAFEQALSNMVHADLAQNAPGLLDYEVGFQLIERSDDNDKAIGVTGFKIGDQWVYAPVFFLNGELKGGELLWLKNQNTFVPRREKWIDYILNRKPVTLGRSVSRDEASDSMSQPDMQSIVGSPLKFSSDLSAWAAPGVGLIAAASRKLPEYRPVLPEFLKESAANSAAFIGLLDQYPTLVPAVSRAYGTQLIRDAIATAKTAATICPVETKRPAKVRGSIWQEPKKAAASELEIFTDTNKYASTLSESERIQLRRKGYLIRDHRKQAATAYRTDKPLRWFNPGTTGLYKVMCSDGKARKVLVVCPPKSPYRDTESLVLVGLEGESAPYPALYVKRDEVFATEQLSKKQFQSWLQSQKRAGKAELSQSERYIAVGPNGEGTAPFSIERSVPAARGRQYSMDVMLPAGPAADPPYPELERPPAEVRKRPNRDMRIWLGATASGKIRTSSNTWMVPRDYKVIPIRVEIIPSESKYVPGGLRQVYRDLLQKTAELKVWTDGTETIINGSRMSPVGAIIRLVKDFGLREKTAAAILTEASRSPRGLRARVKFAVDTPDAMPWLQQGPGAPTPAVPSMTTDPYLASGLPANISTQTVQAVPPDMPLQPAPNMAAPPLNDMSLVGLVQQAARSGQKDVLDVSLLATLLKANREETVVDRYMSKLVSGMDAIGRILASLYAHPELFEERYGEADLAKLEDLLKATFENMGDTVLFLKHKNATTQLDYPDIVNMDEATPGI